MLFFEIEAEPIELLPERLRTVAEFIHICNAAGSELDKGNKLIANAVSNSFIATADDSGLLRWEKILNIFTPLYSTIEARREAVLAKLITKPPINTAFLKSIIEAYMGVAVEITVSGYHITVNYRGESRAADITPLFVTIYDIIPANMTVSISYKYLVWGEVDAQALTWDSLDEMGLSWDEFEKGEWING